MRYLPAKCGLAASDASSDITSTGESPTSEGVRRDFDELSAYGHLARGTDGPVYGGGYLIGGAGGAVIAVIIAVV